MECRFESRSNLHKQSTSGKHIRSPELLKTSTFPTKDNENTLADMSTYNVGASNIAIILGQTKPVLLFSFRCYDYPLADDAFAVDVWLVLRDVEVLEIGV